MKEQSLAQRAADAVAAALQQKQEENGHLQNVLNAFGKTLIEQVRWRADLKGCDSFQIHVPDPELFEKGIPLSDREQLIHLDALWPTAADIIMPSLREGFPRLDENLRRLRTAILDGSFSPDLFLSAAYSGKAGKAGAIAERIGFEPELLLFVLTQLAWPVVAKRSERLFPTIRDIPWNRGYCPVCGTFPELSLLRGKEGRRWLRCGFCAAEWRYHRLSCPFCDSCQPDDSEIFFVEGREHERIEACHHCGRYVAGMDLRSFADEIVPEVMNISLMHLDAVVQKKGFKPMKGIGWKNLEKCDRCNQSEETLQHDQEHTIH
ncbi:MAG: formate dehydrogenase accessory protein FdhE [Syntrophobacteraceae bacterium]